MSSASSSSSGMTLFASSTYRVPEAATAMDTSRSEFQISDHDIHKPVSSEPRGVSVITGAASGLGKATAIAFAEVGRRVLIVDRDAAGAAAVASQIGPPAKTAHVDISREDEVEGLAAELRATGEEVTALVNNAGIALRE